MFSRRFLSWFAPCTLPVALITALGGCSLFGKAPPAVQAGPVRDIAYQIGQGDSLNIFVYQAPQLSIAGLQVRPDGRISMPLIPDIEAAGKTPTALAKDIEARLKEYIKEPNVSVMVSGFIGPLNRQIKVLGEAVEPLAMPYRDQLTLLDVMIQTKGLTRYAAGNSAVIIRQIDGKRQTINVRLSDLLKDGDIDQNVAMLPGDTLIIPQSFF